MAKKKYKEYKTKDERKFYFEKKETRYFNKKRYFRGNVNYHTKKTAEEHANVFRDQGFNIVVDKNKDGHFLWFRTPKSK